MIFRIIAGAGALVWMSAISPVLGADIPARPIVKAPVAAPGYNWYGFFIGVHGGYGWGQNAVNLSSTTPPYALALAGGSIAPSLADDPRGAFAGVQWGSNWQFGQWVIGTISDISWTDIRRSEALTISSPAVPPTTRTNVADQRLRWFGTTRGRVG